MGAMLDESEIDSSHEGEQGEPLGVAPEGIEVRRHAGVAAGVGLTASAVAIAYLGRATQGGSALDWAFVVVMGLLGAYWLVSLVDARTPLLVADAQGIRIRLGRTWRGLPWTAVHHVEHTPRRGLLRDGRLVVVPHNLELIESEMTGAGKRHTTISPDAARRAARSAAGALHPPRGCGWRPHAGARARGPRREPDRPGRAAGHGRRGPRRRPVEPEVVDDALVASPTPAALRETGAARRSEVRRDFEPAEADAGEPEGREHHRPGRVSLVEETQSWGDRVRAIARAGEPVEPLVLDEFEVEPAEDPVIGPELAAARTRLGLTVDQLAERTRIRPHVIEAVEVDDFEPCGGDFYARGHLRTLARVLGVDVAPLLASYDERYAHAPINPRRVFEAELATGANGSIRGTRGGPNWSVLVAVVMALVLCWSIARLVMDTPPELRGSTPVLNGSGGPQGAGNAPPAEPVDVVVTAAATGGAHVVVRDGAGTEVFKGDLAVGQSRELQASPPVRVMSTDGAVTVAVGGGAARAVGEPGIAGQGTFVAD